MSKSKLTLIVDGNWLLMSRKSVMDSRFGSDEELIKELRFLMIKSLNIVLKTFPAIDNIMFVSDGGSWRVDYPKPSFIDEEYKGNREPDPNTDWETIWAGYEHFLNVLKTTGINVYREKGIEGDDWCAYLSHKLNSEGTNCIIWTKDHDLIQLVRTNSDGCFTAWYESNTGIYIEKKDDDEIDFLFNSTYNENEEILKGIIKNSKTVNEINPSDIIIDKIIRGDAGDNIFPIILKRAKNAESTKKFKVAHKDIDFTLDYFNDDAIKSWINKIVNSNSYKDRIIGDKDENTIYEHFIYNRTLVALDNKIYPQYIMDKFNERTAEYTCSTNITEAENILITEKNGDNDIFDIVLNS